MSNMTPTYVIDVVIDGSGSNALVGPFRSFARAERAARRMERALNRKEPGVAVAGDGSAAIMLMISDVTPVGSWREVVEGL